MLPTKLCDEDGVPILQSVAASHDLENPGVDRERLAFACPIEQHTIGYFLPDPGELHEACFGFGIFKGLGFLQPARMRNDEAGSKKNVLCPEAQLAGAKVLFPGSGDGGPLW